MTNLVSDCWVFNVSQLEPCPHLRGTDDQGLDQISNLVALVLIAGRLTAPADALTLLLEHRDQCRRVLPQDVQLLLQACVGIWSGEGGGNSSLHVPEKGRELVLESFLAFFFLCSSFFVLDSSFFVLGSCFSFLFFFPEVGGRGYIQPRNASFFCLYI